MRMLEIKDLPSPYFEFQDKMQQGIPEIEICGLKYVLETPFEHDGKKVNSYICKEAKFPMFGGCLVYAN